MQDDNPIWKVHLVDTGLNTQTGGLVKQLKKWLGKDQTFMLTYGDGVSDINITALLEFHRAHGKLATVTAVRPPARFGGMQFDGDVVTKFLKKPQTGEGWINGGFLCLSAKSWNTLQKAIPPYGNVILLNFWQKLGS